MGRSQAGSLWPTFAGCAGDAGELSSKDVLMPFNLKALTLCIASIGTPALAQGGLHTDHHPAAVAATPAESDAPAAQVHCPMMSGQDMSPGAMPMTPAQGRPMHGDGAMMSGMEPGGMMADAEAMHSDLQALRREIAELRSELRQHPAQSRPR
jgi:hypothetical protein